MRCLIWFREDLRVHDNTALYHAARGAKHEVIAIYILTPEVWQQHDIAKCRIDFILQNLKILSDTLAKLNIPLLIRSADTYHAVPNLLINFIQEFQIDALYYNQQYEINEARRDLAVETLCRQHKFKFFSYLDQIIISPNEILTTQNNYYTIFTPFKKNWQKQFTQQGCHVLPAPNQQLALSIQPDKIPEKIANLNNSLNTDYWPAGEIAAQQRLATFVTQKIIHYDQQRDFPALDGTSQISPYLANGILSPRQCLQAALQANNNHLTEGNAGILTWISELIWREFYKYILYHTPRISMHRAFKLTTEKLTWHNDTNHFNAWCAGKTGYPIIDAAMRQLQQTGWMHNRLRMLVAMFLVKDLWIDWRWGEKYFMQHLIDGDLAANNGGWQWAASTGTDAVPYFRIFNPITQSEKFDPKGDFIRRYCPELSTLDNKLIHNPSVLIRKKLNYPSMIIDHNRARLHALNAFKNLT